MRRLSLTLSVLVPLGLFLANVAVAGQDDILLQITNPAPAVASSEAAPACKTEFSPLEGAIPAAVQMCGSCSPSAICRGVQLYTFCGGGKSCKNLYGNFCSAGPPISHSCTCSDGVLE